MSMSGTASLSSAWADRLRSRHITSAREANLFIRTSYVCFLSCFSVFGRRPGVKPSLAALPVGGRFPGAETTGAAIWPPL